MTYIIIFVTATVSIMAFSRRHMMQKLMFNPYEVKNNREYYRFITSGFLHADWMHLGVNMLVLYFFGPSVEIGFKYYFQYGANLLFILMYLLAIICSSIFTYFKHVENPQYNSLGASGAVSAVLFVYILFQPFSTISIYGIIPIPALLAGVGYLVYSVYMSRQARDNVNHDAHFYGAIFGILYTIILKPDIGLHFVHQIMSVL